MVLYVKNIKTNECVIVDNQKEAADIIGCRASIIDYIRTSNVPYKKTWIVKPATKKLVKPIAVDMTNV